MGRRIKSHATTSGKSGRTRQRLACMMDGQEMKWDRGSKANLVSQNLIGTDGIALWETDTNVNQASTLSKRISPHAQSCPYMRIASNGEL